MGMTFQEFSERYESLFWKTPGANDFVVFKNIEAMLGHPLPSDITGKYLNYIGLYTFADVLSVANQSCFNHHFNITFWFRNILSRFLEYIDQNTIWPELRWLFMFEGRNKEIPQHTFFSVSEFNNYILSSENAADARQYALLNDSHVRLYLRLLDELNAVAHQHCAHIVAYNKQLDCNYRQSLIDEIHAERTQSVILEDDEHDAYPPRRCDHRHLFTHFKSSGAHFMGSGYDPFCNIEWHGSSLDKEYEVIGIGCGMRKKLYPNY